MPRDGEGHAPDPTASRWPDHSFPVAAWEINKKQNAVRERRVNGGKGNVREWLSIYFFHKEKSVLMD